MVYSVNNRRMHKMPFEAYRGFLSLLRVGLWEDIVKVNGDGLEDIDLPVTINYDEILHFAQVQSVVGLVAAGIEVSGCKIPLTSKLKYTGLCLQIEQCNVAMNRFFEDLMSRLQQADIAAVLVKGQGVAQCHVRPKWRGAGDVDLLLGEDYEKAVKLLSAVALKVEKENPFNLHQAMTIDSWTVELHGTLRGLLKKRLDKVVDEIQVDTFTNNRVRVWHNGSVDIMLPAPDNDVIFVFSHLLQHFFKESVNLRQISDWCRLLWTYKDSLNHKLLESRIKSMGVMTEWKAFAALAVDYLGMPIEAMPFYSDDMKWKRKAARVMEFVLETGNFGHNRDYSYRNKYPYIIYKAISFWKHLKDGAFFFSIFPLDSIKVTWRRMVVGVSVVLQGKKHE